MFSPCLTGNFGALAALIAIVAPVRDRDRHVSTPAYCKSTKTNQGHCPPFFKVFLPDLNWTPGRCARGGISAVVGNALISSVLFTRNLSGYEWWMSYVGLHSHGSALASRFPKQIRSCSLQ